MIFANPSVMLESKMIEVPPYRPSYAMLFDPQPEHVVALAAANPNRFVFTFLTSDAAADLRDWSALPRSDFIVKPIYIGYFRAEDIDSVARQLVARALELDPDDV